MWALREAAIAKVQLLLQEEFESKPGVPACLAALLTIVRVGVDDKIQQVFFGALNLLEGLMSASKRYVACIDSHAYAHSYIYSLYY